MDTTVISQFETMGVFPIIVIEDADDAEPLGEALLRGGMPCAEVTFRTQAAAAAISRLRESFPQMLLGAGTVLQVEQVDQAVDAGARFILAPGFNPRVVDYCLAKNIPVFPGVCTPTEVEAALGKGLNVLKFFPAEAMGGVNYLKAISAPLSMVRFLPTGGVNLKNLSDYLNFDRVLACAGTWIAKRDRLKERRFDLIEEDAAKAVSRVAQIRKEKRHG